MGYSNPIQVDLLLSNSFSSSRPGTSDKVRLINIPASNPSGTTGVNLIPNDIVEYFIHLADNEINGILSQMYKTPLRKCAEGQWTLDSDIYEYNQTIEVSEPASLVPGDEIIIRDDLTGTEEIHVVATILDQSAFTVLDPIITPFEASETTRVFRIDYPPPIPQISTRYAVSFIFDKYFTAQNSPDSSEFGKEQRSIAMGQLNDILNGKTILYCQERIGDRFGNPQLDDSYSLRDRGFSTSDRNMSLPK